MHDADDPHDDPDLVGNAAPPPAADAAGGDDLLARVMRRLLNRGRTEIGRAARTGRSRLERRQLQKDLDHFWVRLGKTAFRLVEAGEIDHPSLRLAMQRIEELEAQLDGLRSASPPAPGADDGHD